MKMLVEPNSSVDRLWGKQPIRENEVYRLMRYVIRTEYDGQVLLLNVVTGQLVLLDQDEALMLERLPMPYYPIMEQLVTNHYLVRDSYDEHQQVLNLRKVLRKLDDANLDKDIVHYTILPTTACNARCYYCFEQGTPVSTMSEQTAAGVVDFITEESGKDKTVAITWFGGEPTVAAGRISQISEGLRKNGINYRSKMLTNGYLFDSAMIAKAKELWHLFGVQICVDGTESSYNKIKAYAAAKENPYQRVMRNVGLLLGAGIAVGIRMNFDLGNYQEFIDLTDEVYDRFGTNKLLRVSAHPVVGEYRDYDGNLLHADDEWLAYKACELNHIARIKGWKNLSLRLPYLNGDACSAATGKSITIRPDGGISRCAELFSDKDLIGNIKVGIINKDLDASWKLVADYDMCRRCVLFPFCVRLVNCPNKTYCHKLVDYSDHYNAIIKNHMTQM